VIKLANDRKNEKRRPTKGFSGEKKTIGRLKKKKMGGQKASSHHKKLKKKKTMKDRSQSILAGMARASKQCTFAVSKENKRSREEKGTGEGGVAGKQIDSNRTSST